MLDKLEYNKQYYAVNKQRMRQQAKAWYYNNKEHIKEYWELTREKTRERQRRWYAKNKKVIQKLVEEKVVKIIPIIEAEPEPPKPRGRPKTGRISETEKKQRKINRDLEEIQRKADAFKMSLQCIDAAQKNKDAPDSSGDE